MDTGEGDGEADAPLLGGRGQGGEDVDTLPLRNLGSWFIWALTFSAGISGLLFGYDTGVISSTLVSIGTDLSHRELSILDKSLVTSSTSLFALLSSPLAGTLADRFGRKPVILVADALFVLGALWQCFSSTVWGMIIGRSVVGLAIGMASVVTPLYVSELSPSHLRGRMVTIVTLLITGGQVVAFVVGWLFSAAAGGWRWIVGLGAVPAILQVLLISLLPETPRWLVKVGRESEARKVMIRVHGSSKASGKLVDRILGDINCEIEEETRRWAITLNGPSGSDESEHQYSSTGRLKAWLTKNTESYSELFTVGCNRRALVIACMLQAFQQLCGFNSLMYFAATIFKLLSFSSPTLTALSVAVTNFLFTLLVFSLIDRIGRRRILLSSIPFMIVSLVFCSISFSQLHIPTSPSTDSPHEQTRIIPSLILLGLTVYTAAYACGLGNVPWQQSELFPLPVRSLGSSLATATNWGANFIVGLTFLPFMEWLTPSWTFAIYAAVCVVGWGGVWWIYPEMSGFGLEDVRVLLADGWGVEESLCQFRERKADKDVGNA